MNTSFAMHRQANGEAAGWPALIQLGHAADDPSKQMIRVIFCPPGCEDALPLIAVRFEDLMEAITTDAEWHQLVCVERGGVRPLAYGRDPAVSDLSDLRQEAAG